MCDNKQLGWKDQQSYKDTNTSYKTRIADAREFDKILVAMSFPLVVNYFTSFIQGNKRLEDEDEAREAVEDVLKCHKDVQSNLGEIFPLVKRMKQNKCRNRYTQQEKETVRQLGVLFSVDACYWDTVVGSCSSHVKTMPYYYWLYAN